MIKEKKMNPFMNPGNKTIAVVCIFSIAMAALESAVVVYLRALYYPDGFSVAFKLIDEKILRVEILREIATLTMLAAVGYLSGKHFRERLAYFLLAFAVWDIFYYGWLRIMINWPSTIMEWDILFLIPFTWLGPVLAPVVCALTMILLTLTLLRHDRRISWKTWTLWISGSMLILYTFMQDYGGLILTHGFITDYPHLLRNADFVALASGFLPEHYNWPLFCIGESMLLAGVLQHSQLFTAKRHTGQPGETPLQPAAQEKTVA